MPNFLKKIVVAFWAAAFLVYQIYFTPPPSSWNQATLGQIFLFFIPMVVLVTALVDLVLRNLARSLVIGLSVMFLTILESINLLNIITGAIVTLCVITLLYIFDTPPQLSKKPQKAAPQKIVKKLTSEQQIPKLTKFQQKRRRDQRKRR